MIATADLRYAYDDTPFRKRTYDAGSGNYFTNFQALVAHDAGQ
jgi:hypothetical protein